MGDRLINHARKCQIGGIYGKEVPQVHRSLRVLAFSEKLPGLASGQLHAKVPAVGERSRLSEMPVCGRKAGAKRMQEQRGTPSRRLTGLTALVLNVAFSKVYGNRY